MIQFLAGGAPKSYSNVAKWFEDDPTAKTPLVSRFMREESAFYARTKLDEVLKEIRNGAAVGTPSPFAPLEGEVTKVVEQAKKITAAASVAAPDRKQMLYDEANRVRGFALQRVHEIEAQQRR
jgi:hypothetical protein